MCLSKILRRIIRYPTADLYMLVACIIASACLIITVSYMNQKWKITSEILEYSYSSTYTASLENTSETTAIKNILTKCKSTVLLEDVPVLVSNAINSAEIEANIPLSNKEDVLLPITRGELRLGVDTESTCIIGAEIAHYYHCDINDELLINGISCTVTGILDSSGGTFNGEIYLFGIIADKVFYQALNSGKVTLCFATNSGDSYQVFLDIYSSIKAVDGNSLFYGVSETDSKIGNEYSSMTLVYELLYIFAMVHCVIASDTWVFIRRKEIILKRTLGYSLPLLFGDLLWQMLKNVSFSMLISYCLITILHWANFTNIQTSFSVKGFVFLICCVFLTAIINVVFCIHNLLRKSVIVNLSGAKRL